MSAHTKGPWHRSQLRTAGADPRLNGVDIGAKDGSNVAIVYYQTGEHTPEKTTANARLIAKAPEMAQEIERLTDELAELRNAAKHFLTMLATEAPASIYREAMSDLYDLLEAQ